MKRANRKTGNTPRAQAAWTPCYCAGIGPRLTALTCNLFEGPVCNHFRTAGVEVLLGLRAILDAQIEAMSRETRKKGAKVPVE